MYVVPYYHNEDYQTAGFLIHIRLLVVALSYRIWLPFPSGIQACSGCIIPAPLCRLAPPLVCVCSASAFGGCWLLAKRFRHGRSALIPAMALKMCSHGRYMAAFNALRA